MHFGDYTFIFLLALVLFGPKKLPEIGRQIGRLMMEFRHASNEFKMQMDEELRSMEEQERQKRLEASLKEQTERVLAVAPQTEPLPSDPSEIVQPLRHSPVQEDPEYPGEPYVAALPPEECNSDLEPHAIHDVIKHHSPQPGTASRTASTENPHEPPQPDNGEAVPHA